MNATLKLIALGCTVVAASTASAQGLGRFVDAANFAIDPAAFNIAIGGGSDEKIAQTLTVEVGGTLAGLFVPVACGDGRLLIEIRDVVAGVPGPTVLASRGAPVADFPLFGRFTYIPIPGALALSAGQEIAWVLDNRRGTCVISQSTVASNYPGGHGYFDARPNAIGVWVANGDFPNTPDDWPFQLVLD